MAIRPDLRRHTFFPGVRCVEFVSLGCRWVQAPSMHENKLFEDRRYP
jgi:hypothetical protein